MASIYKRGKYWWICYYVNGKKYQKSLKTLHKNEAKYIKTQYEALLPQKEFIIPDQKIVLIDFLEEYVSFLQSTINSRTALRYKQALENFKVYAKENNLIYLNSVTKENIDNYIVYRINEGLSPKTINEELRLIKNLFKRAIEYKYLTKNPAENIKPLKYIPKPPLYFKKEELQLIMEFAPKRYKLIFEFLLKTGVRLGELANLEWSDIDFKRGTITIGVKSDWQPKNQRTRIIPISSSVHRILIQRKRMKESDRWVFTTPAGKRYTNIRTRFIETLKEIREKRNIDIKGTIHTFRHTFASHLVMSGASLAAVQKLLGHSTIQMTMKYAHLAPDHLRDTIKKLDEII